MVSLECSSEGTWRVTLQGSQPPPAPLAAGRETLCHLLRMSFLIITVQVGHIPLKVFLEFLKGPNSLVECST